MTGKRTPLAERFWAKVDKRGPDECWPWTGALNNKGYGHIGRGGRGDGDILAHRASWEIHHGPIPDGLNVLHRCDNPPCCNDAHHFLGTKAANSADMVVKRRQGHIKFSEEEVFAVRGARGSQQEIATRFGMSKTHVGRIQRGEHYLFNTTGAASHVGN